MTSGAFAAAHLELSPRFAKTAQQPIVTVTISTGVGAESIPNRLQRGEAADVVILPDEALNQLIKDGLIVASTRVPLARSEIGMAVRAGAPKPDISSVTALRNALLQAKSVAYSASVSGIYLSTELFPKLGIADQMKSKSLRIERERVGAVVARGEAEIGFQQITELLEIKGIDYVGPLPPEVQRVTLVSAGVPVIAKNPEGARRLIQFFASANVAADLRKVGLQPLVPPSDDRAAAAPVATIEGRWKLIAAEDLRADGSVARLPWGRHPVGSIVVDRGFCFLQILSSDVPSFAEGAGAIGDRMKAALLSTYIAYAGPCTVDPVEGSVTLKVEAAWRPDYVGSEQKRFFRLDGSKMYFGPASGSIRAGDERLTRRLTLERVAPD